MSKTNKDFLPVYNKLLEWVQTDYNSNTSKWIKPEHAEFIYNFINSNAKHRKQDNTASIITKYLEASLGQKYIRVGDAVSSFFTMVYGHKLS